MPPLIKFLMLASILGHFPPKAKAGLLQGFLLGWAKAKSFSASSIFTATNLVLFMICDWWEPETKLPLQNSSALCKPPKLALPTLALRETSCTGTVFESMQLFRSPMSDASNQCGDVGRDMRASLP